ncbi:Aflatoxin biosynthesis regulatory protein [Penicillium hispanicum]|uniref:Aflatoxin biosynthesis regulatory protein n=1 Tax=Penicillium hispanicum TaxID=1080232 RepID=UPI002540DF66|nr:Aflatoxin biosynthesis regulatory protein [Penicillium hispanicum]KAJ5579957.1 Aflatoxin biosynthesis regulatory protein [Penicillium hispanicum]
MRRVKKSRNGCARCKSKRVKCGEEKPHCNRCTRLGVRCPGYTQSLRWVTKYEGASPGASSDGKAPSPAASAAATNPSKQPSQRTEDALSLENGNAGPSTDPDPPGFRLESPNPLCDNLWDLPGSGSLPELTDLCPPSPIPASASTFTQPRGSEYNPLDSDDAATDLSRFLSLIEPAQDEEEHRGSVYRGFSPAAIIRSYLPSAQRPAPRDSLSISRPLNNPSWTLIEYYFKEVAALFSSYDSQMNPFRTTVSRLWGSSLAMCRTMQSMAAASLVNDFPQFGPMGRKMRDEAVDIITREAVMDDKALLALLMLGQTASWHDPNDLGIAFFNLLRKQLDSTASTPNAPGLGSVKNYSNNYRFFDEALIYWEMLLSFVADNDAMVFSDNSCASSMGESLVLQRVPHPWTGIARDTQFTVHEVGRLVRRERKRIRTRSFTSQEEIRRAQMAIEKARELEERLLGLAHPTEAEIVSPGDDETPVWHLLTMAEVYRCTGLMQLYRVFPDLLRHRLPNPSEAHYPGSVPSTSLDPFFPIDLDSMNIPSNFCDASPAPTGTRDQSQDSSHPLNQPPHPQPSPSPPIHIFPAASQAHEQNHETSSSFPQDSHSETLYDTWLTEFAMTTLSRLKTIPFESRTRCLQPFLLVASCSELRLPPTFNSPNHHQPNNEHNNAHRNTEPAASAPESGTDTPSVSMEAIEVSRTRRFILGRLTSFLHVLPPKPINVCLKLVKEVWKRMDAGQPDTYWIDVMIEKGWETTMG